MPEQPTEITWSRNLPCKLGFYVYRNDREWVHYLKELTQGDWRLAQNPEWIYTDDKPLNVAEPGWWFGPIPRAPQSMAGNGK